MAGGQVRIIPEEVVHETVDGEVILIALQTGAYYSLEGSAAEIWDALVDGRSPADVVADLERRYAGGSEGIRSAVIELLERLVDERLVVADGDPGAALRATGPSAGDAAAGVPFPPPVFHKFTDMQDFLLVDPIHEVGEAGWPHAPVAG